MAKKKKSPSGSRAQASVLDLKLLLRSPAKTSTGFSARLLYSSDKKSLEKDKSVFASLADWQKKWILSTPGKVLRVSDGEGVVLVYWEEPVETKKTSDEALNGTEETRIRELCGPLKMEMDALGVRALEVHLLKASRQAEKFFSLGFELADYRYQKVGENLESTQLTFYRSGKKVSTQQMEEGRALGQATNMARHLVNLPSNMLNPKTYSESIEKLFRGTAGVKVNVWTEERLKAENMNLLLAVGRSGEFAPRMVHIRYRPSRSKEKGPWAFVGKGITFDSGGLDIKPPSAMRWMKKDMGGSAAVVGFAWWCVRNRIPQAMDFYISLAENAVDERSFRPGDIITARSGLKIEIHNTDAEGRLVMADALDVAISQSGKDKPSLVMDIATLTGAIKVGLGSQLAGLFSNQTRLRDQLYQASLEAGDLSWPMPLFQAYRGTMVSPVADMTNAVDGFGGAVTAALFLESFVKDTPWAHLDIYAWKDAPGGAYLEAGGSGQAVQLLSRWAETRLKK